MRARFWGAASAQQHPMARASRLRPSHQPQLEILPPILEQAGIPLDIRFYSFPWFVRRGRLVLFLCLKKNRRKTGVLLCRSLKHCCLPEVAVDVTSVCPKSRISHELYHLPVPWLLYLLPTSFSPKGLGYVVLQDH